MLFTRNMCLAEPREARRRVHCRSKLWWHLDLRMGLSAVSLRLFETKNVGIRFFQWFAYRLPSAIFVYHAPIGLHEVVAPTFPQSLLKLCYTVARQLYGHLQLYIYIYIYIYIFRSNLRGLAPEARQIY